MLQKIAGLIIISIFSINTYCATIVMQPAITSSIEFKELTDAENYSSAAKSLIDHALTLTKQNLTYQYGSANPKNKGMDCSGTIYYLLKQMNVDVPRQSNEIYQWAWQHGKFYPVNSHQFSSFEFAKLKPGDLLFWTGTYDIQRDPPITHVMIYLGKNRQQQPLMIGASDGRTYQGKKMWGVSVFDFLLPDANSKSRFIGYSCIPTLTCDEKMHRNT